MSVISISPFPNGLCLLASRDERNGQTNYLRAHAPGSPNGVSLTPDLRSATLWNLVYDTSRGSYTIWQQGTNNVLDAARQGSGIASGSVTTFGNNGRDWQRWAIRMHSDGGSVKGFSLTPLSEHHLALTAQQSSLIVTNPPHGLSVVQQQLFIRIPVDQRQASKFGVSGMSGEKAGFGGEMGGFGSQGMGEFGSQGMGGYGSQGMGGISGSQGMGGISGSQGMAGFGSQGMAGISGSQGMGQQYDEMERQIEETKKQLARL